MNEHELAKRLDKDLEGLSRTGGMPEAGSAPEDYIQRIKIAQQLKQADFSSESKVHEDLRLRLQERTRRELPGRAARQEFTRRTGRALRLSAGLAFLVIIGLAVNWLFRLSVPQP